MNGDRPEVSRRRVLGTLAAAGSAIVAGCGYQPGGGDLDWQETASDGVGFGNSSDGLWRSDGTSLFRIRNRSGRDVVPGEGFQDVDDARVTAYGSSGSTVWSGESAAQYVGDPAVASGRVFLSLEDGSVAALERAPSDDDSGRDSTDDAETAWTTDWDGPDLSLEASDEIVAGAHEEGVVAFDPDDGEERFAIDLETEPFDVIDSIAVGGGTVWVTAADDSDTDAIDDSDTGDDDSGNTNNDSATDDGDNENTTNDDGDDADGDPVLLGYDSAGEVVVDRSLPSIPYWLETAGSAALVGVETENGEGELWVIDDSDDRRGRVSLERTTNPPVVGDDYAYHLAGETVRSIDVSSGERRFALEGYSVRGEFAVDADRVYARGSAPEMDQCGLFAVDHDGETAWTASLPAEPGCSGELFALEDRLIVIDNGELYGFRNTSGRRLTLL